MTWLWLAKELNWLAADDGKRDVLVDTEEMDECIKEVVGDGNVNKFGFLPRDWPPIEEMNVFEGTLFNG